MLPGEGSVLAAMAASLRPPGCAVQRQAFAGAGSARGGRIRGVRPSWCACLVVSRVAGVRPEEARAIWLGGRRDRCSTEEGFPGSSRLQHALMPNSGRRVPVCSCADLCATNGGGGRQFSLGHGPRRHRAVPPAPNAPSPSLCSPATISTLTAGSMPPTDVRCPPLITIRKDNHLPPIVSAATSSVKSPSSNLPAQICSAGPAAVL
jgi:hypothetical protein